MTKTPLSSPSSSSSSSLISPNLNLGLGVLYTAEVEGVAAGPLCVPTSKYRDGRSGGCFFFFFARVSLREDSGSGKALRRNSAIAFVRVLRVISAYPIFLRNLTHLSKGCCFSCFCFLFFFCFFFDGGGCGDFLRGGGGFFGRLWKLFVLKRDTFYVTLFREIGND